MSEITKATKQNLVDLYVELHGVTAAEARRRIDEMTKVFTVAADTYDKVSWSGIGIFRKAHRAARTARNPKNGEPVEVAESYTVRFKPAPQLFNTVNGVSE